MAGSEVDVVVVGGGISGLSAAYQLKKWKPDLRVVVLEAKERLGGRTQTVYLNGVKGKDKWDLGGQWVGRTQVHIMDLIEELKLETYQQYDEGKRIFQMGKNGQPKEYKGTIPLLAPWTLYEIWNGLRRLTKLSQSIPSHDPYQHPEAVELDSMTVQTFKNSNLRSEVAKNGLDVILETLFGVKADQMSVLYASFYVSTCGADLEVLMETNKGSAQEFKVKGGTQQISQKLAEKIGLENVLVSEPVVDIHQSNNSTVKVSTATGKSFKAKKVIVAIPLHLNESINYEPNLPVSRLFLHRNTQIGNLTKIIVTYEKTFWREKGYSGSVATDGLNCPYKVNGLPMGPLDIIFDATSSEGNPALVCFMSADRGNWWSTVEAEERKKAVLRTLSMYFGQEALKPIDYAEKFWCFEPYNGGCPTNCHPPGTMQWAGIYLRKPFGSIHWAGTESSTVWTGYMDGAVYAGKRAAAEVLHNLHPSNVTAEAVGLYCPSVHRDPRPSKSFFSISSTGTGWFSCLLNIFVFFLCVILVAYLWQKYLA